MITAIINDIQNGVPVIATGTLLAEKFKKNFRQILADEIENIADFCEANEVSFLLIQLSENKSGTLQKLLNACRNLRIPYLFWKNSFAPFCAEQILVPVTFLEEEIEKAQFAAAFGRFLDSQITVLQANDYGTKARKTAEKMCTLFDKFSLDYEMKIARKDSFHLHKEVLKTAQESSYSVILLSASREYGLDDVIFGPPERKVVLQSAVPVVLVNPRADLYALCD